MKKVLCYGDSNTFGFNPADGSRYQKTQRWSGMLVDLLGSQYRVIEEGCNNRTLYFENAAGLITSGCKYFTKCLKKYDNIDFVILALGLNDTQFLYNADESTFQKGLSALISDSRKFFSSAQILVLAPSVIKKTILNSFFAQMFDETSIEKSKIICDIYKKITDNQGCLFLDLNTIVTPSDIDGLHYDIDAHKKIAKEVAKIISDSQQNE